MRQKAYTETNMNNTPNAYGRSLIGINYHDSPPPPIRLSEAGSRGRIIIFISERIIHIIHIRFSKIFG